MWALWMIIAVAVGGAVSLTVTAVLTVVYFERRRHRKLMARHMNRTPSHRNHLSITDVDIASLPRAAKSLRDSYQQPRRESLRFYSTIPSQDEIKIPETTSVDHNPQQWLTPSRSKRFSRKKKIAKVSSLSVTKSPMSAITEATEPSRSATPEPVELPAHITPEMTPERAGIPMTVKVVDSIDTILTPQGTSHGIVLKSRSISTGSIAPPPPNIPLPPVPNTAPFDPRRRSLSRSKSDISLRQREASILSQQKMSNGRFSGFRFELTGEDISTKAERAAFRFPAPDDSLKTIDASTWLPHSLRTSRPITPTPPTISPESASRSVSMIDYDAIFSAGSSLDNSPTRQYDSRPVSAASVTSSDMFRLSVVGGDAPRMGHKRQNCVRIKNLTPVNDSKRRLSSQLSRLAEAEEDDDSILLPSPARMDQIPNATESDVPIVKQPQAQSLRVRRPGWTSIKDKNRMIRPLPDLTKQADTTVTDISPTILEAVQTSGSPLPNSPQRQRTQIQGPRTAPPPSLRVHKQTSPIRRKSSESDRTKRQHHHHPQKVNTTDLSKSIAMLKTMTFPNVESPTPTMPIARTPSSRYADSPSLRIPKIRNRSNTVAGHGGERIHLQSPRNNQHLLLTVQHSAALPLTYSPSSISIWEDASVGGDSPDRQRERDRERDQDRKREPSTEGESQQSRTRPYSPVKLRRDHFDQLSTYSRNMSSQQYQQLGQQPQGQREGLWRMQQNTTSLGNITSSSMSIDTEKTAKNLKGLTKLQTGTGMGMGMDGSGNLHVPVPVSVSMHANAKAERIRGHTVSVAGRSGGVGGAQSEGEVVGLGLKFGEKSMAYTVNEMERVGTARLR